MTDKKPSSDQINIFREMKLLESLKIRGGKMGLIVRHIYFCPIILELIKILYPHSLICLFDSVLFFFFADACINIKYL